MDNKKITVKFLAATSIGIILVIIGLVWFLQGTGILQLCPILCFADCECVTGGSRFWEAAGIIAVITGAVIVWLSVSRVLGNTDQQS
jgi:hypothetical protein